MNAEYLLLWSFICVLVLAAHHVLHRKTLLGINLSRGNLGGVVLLVNIGLFVLPGVVVISSMDVSWVSQLRNTRLPDARATSFWILYALTIFSFSTWLLSFVLRRDFRQPLDAGARRPSNDRCQLRKLKYLLAAQILSASLVFVGSYAVFGLRHAVIETLVAGDGLLGIRLANRYEVGVPGPVLSYLTFMAYFIAVTLGRPELDMFRGLRGAGAVVALFLSTASGNKALPLYTVMLGMLSYFSYHGVTRIKRKALATVALFILLFGLIFFSMIYLQFGSVTFDWIKEYLFVRVVLGQVAGTYEQFALGLGNTEYWWHAVPFASLFVDYPIHAKDLMVVSENVRDPSRTGVKNSLFIAEAHAMGGLPLVLMSPLIVAVSYIVGFGIFRWLISKTFGISGFDKAAFLIYAKMLSLTGDFSSFVLLKGLVLNSLFVLTVASIYWMLRAFTGALSNSSSKLARPVCPHGR